MRSRSNGGVIGAYQLPSQNYANGVFFIHDAAIYNTGPNPIWPLAAGLIRTISSTGTVTESIDLTNSNYKLQTFSSNGTFTVVSGSGPIDIFMVGGGGSGGAMYTTGAVDYIMGGGGGGGQVGVISSFVNGGTTFTVEVGLGGISSVATTPTYPREGKPSKVTSTEGHSYVVGGGGRGGSLLSAASGNPDNGTAGGAGTYGSGSGGGGGATYSTGTRTGGTSSTYTGYYSNDGAPSATTLSNAGNATGSMAAGGGGGATGPGYSGNYPTNYAYCGAGGPGYLWTPTGLSYGSGGGGARMYNISSSAANEFNGGVVYNQTGLSTYGGGGYDSLSNNGSVGYSNIDGYGGGGGGAVLNLRTGTTTLLGGNGGRGTVIFRYRYQ